MTARLLTIVSAISLWSAPAEAQGDQPVLVLQLSGQATGSFADAPQVLSATLAEVVRQTGSEVNESTRDDVLALAGCAEPTDDCLRQALGMLEVREAITGEVQPADGGLSVELRVVPSE